MVSVSADQTTKEAGAFAKEIGATFPVVHDPAGKIFDAYGVGAMPTNVVVGRNGKVVRVIEGVDLKALDTSVTRAVATK